MCRNCWDKSVSPHEAGESGAAVGDRLPAKEPGATKEWVQHTDNMKFGIPGVEYSISLAKRHAPNDILTKTAILSVKVATTVLLILTPLEWVTTAIGGCLIAVTFGILIFILTLIWWPFLALLLSTSWLWLRAWYLRPILLVPGVLIAILAYIYVMLAPEPERDAKYAKLALADEWPLSWYLLRPPPEH